LSLAASRTPWRGTIRPQKIVCQTILVPCRNTSLTLLIHPFPPVRRQAVSDLRCRRRFFPICLANQPSADDPPFDFAFILKSSNLNRDHLEIFQTTFSEIAPRREAAVTSFQRFPAIDLFPRSVASPSFCTQFTASMVRGEIAEPACLPLSTGSSRQVAVFS